MEIVVTVAVAATALVVILMVLLPAAVIVIVVVRRKRDNGNADNCPRATRNVDNPVYGSKHMDTAVGKNTVHSSLSLPRSLSSIFSDVGTPWTES